MLKNDIIETIKLSLWDDGTVEVSSNTYEEMKHHAVSAIIAPVLPSVIMSEQLKREWQTAVLQHIAYYVNYKHVQENLPISVPYVILKGTSAAQYYPHPEYRTMGDIDVMTRREDFDAAYRQLVEGGFQPVKRLEREVGFVKDGIMIELHRYFASLNDPAQAKYLDDLIIENITPSHVLPDPVNGLVLLEHISQHLENGLGLRQIIDWMMFVDKCLPDEKWGEFREMAQRIGLENLAIAATRMCEIYLGLPERSWCAGADEKLCEQFMEYVLACGDFGNKHTDDSSIAENVIAHARNPKSAFRLLQIRGHVNWRAARKYRFLHPFAWIYQLFRYFVLGIRRGKSMSKLKEEYRAAKRRNDMFDQLGIKQASKGLVVYRDGKYVKK